MKLLQGVLLGLVIGILVAPDSGSETRRKLAGKLSGFKDDAQDYLSDAADNIKDKAGDIADTVKSKARTVAGKVKSGTEQGTDNQPA
jgi:gas vesicle protein